MADPSEQQIMPPTKGAIQQVASAEIDQQVATARRFPRDAIKAKADSMAIATRNQETATACFYLLKRGKKRIIGPSIRLAEILCQNWGNLRCDTRIEEIGRTRLTAASAVWDLERNVLVVMRSQRGITYSGGGRYNEDMITTTANAAASIAFRNAVFKLIPPDITEAIFQKCQDVSAGTAKAFAQNRIDMVQAFEAIDVPLEVILNEFGAQHLDDVGRQEMLFLRAAYTSITKEGMDATSIFVGRKEKGAQASPATDPAPSPAAQSSEPGVESHPAPEGPKAAQPPEGDAPNAASIIANAQADPSKADTPRVYDSSRMFDWIGVTAEGEEVSGEMEAPSADVVSAVLRDERHIKPLSVSIQELRDYHWTGTDKDGEKVSGKLKTRAISDVKVALQKLEIEFDEIIEFDPETEGAPLDPAARGSEGDGDGDQEADFDWRTTTIPADGPRESRVAIRDVLHAKLLDKSVTGKAEPRDELVNALNDLTMQVERLRLDKPRLQRTFSGAPDSYYEKPQEIATLIRWVVARLTKKPTPGAAE